MHEPVQQYKRFFHPVPADGQSKSSGGYCFGSGLGYTAVANGAIAPFAAKGHIAGVVRVPAMYKWTVVVVFLVADVAYGATLEIEGIPVVVAILEIEAVAWLGPSPS